MIIFTVVPPDIYEVVIMFRDATKYTAVKNIVIGDPGLKYVLRYEYYNKVILRWISVTVLFKAFM